MFAFLGRSSGLSLVSGHAALWDGRLSGQPVRSEGVPILLKTQVLTFEPEFLRACLVLCST